MPRRTKAQLKTLKRNRERALEKLIARTGQRVCQICGREALPGRGFTGHHIDYEKNIEKLLCKACHCWAHGMGKVWTHPFKEKYGRDMAPYEFARAIVRLYEEGK